MVKHNELFYPFPRNLLILIPFQDNMGMFKSKYLVMILWLIWFKIHEKYDHHVVDQEQAFDLKVSLKLYRLKSLLVIQNEVIHLHPKLQDLNCMLLRLFFYTKVPSHQCIHFHRNISFLVVLRNINQHNQIITF